MRTRSSSNLVGETSTNLKHRFKDLLRACPHYGFTKLHQLDTFYNALTATDQDSLNATAGGNLLTKTPRDALTIIENKSKVRNLRNKPVVSKKSSPPASVKAVEEICVTCGGPHPYYQCLATDGNVFLEYRDNIQGYVSAAAVNYNQGNTGYRPPSIANQIRPPDFAQPNVQNNKTKYNQGYNQNRGTNQENQNYQAPIQQPQVAPSNELNEMQTSIQASMSNQTNELKNMMASFFQMNTASSSGSGPLPSNTIANLKGELKSITTRSGIVLDGPSVPMPTPFINLEEDERAEETLTDPKLAEYTIEYQNMLKALLSNKEKLLELENTPLNENCSAVILKKLPEKLRDPGKFLIPGSFSELNCKALADLVIILLRSFAHELALIESFPPGNDDITLKDVIREIEYLLNRDPLYSPNNDFIYTILEMFTDEHILDYSSPPRYDDADDDLFDLKTDNDEWGKTLYDDPFDSKENKIKDSKLLVDELDSPGSSSFLPHFLERTSFSMNFHDVRYLTSTDNETSIQSSYTPFTRTFVKSRNRVTQDKNVKKISSIAPDYEASRARGFVLRSLELQSFA
ncbi:hypothetical protein Tco_1541861 [Tanacetum coccineum]